MIIATCELLFANRTQSSIILVNVGVDMKKINMENALVKHKLKYFKSRIVSDIDECRGYKAVCDRNAWCVNEIGSYKCECMASYRGDGKHCTYVGLGEKISFRSSFIIDI